MENNPSLSSQCSLRILETLPQNNKAFNLMEINHKPSLEVCRELSPGLGVQDHVKLTQVNGSFAIDLS